MLGHGREQVKAIDDVSLDVEEGERVKLGIKAVAKITAKTGVEMEALTAVAVAALTVYDMCKALDKGMTISDVRLELKTGGKSGDYRREPNAEGTS